MQTCLLKADKLLSTKLVYLLTSIQKKQKTHKAVSISPPSPGSHEVSGVSGQTSQTQKNVELSTKLGTAGLGLGGLNLTVKLLKLKNKTNIRI